MDKPEEFNKIHVSYLVDIIQTIYKESIGPSISNCRSAHKENHRMKINA